MNKFSQFERRTMAAARVARQRPERGEWELWQELRKSKLGVRFVRQYCVFKFGYRLDFYCASRRLGIEIDGPWHQTAQGKEHDELRTKRLQELGIEVMRFSVGERAADVAQKIKVRLFGPDPNALAAPNAM